MSNEAAALAVTTQNHDQPAALQAAQQASLVASAAVVLDRANLQFFADMIEAAELIPYDKNIPRSVQKYRAMSKIVAGIGHDFDPISSQENFHVIGGRCVLSARGMAIKLRRTGQYDTRVEKLDDEGCRLAVLEKNSEGKWILKGHVNWGHAEAERAGLLTSNKNMYDKWKPDMYFANAMKRVCRRFAPEAMDTKPVLYDTAKRPVDEAAPAPAQIGTAETATPQDEPIDTAAPEVGQEYVDQEYTGVAAEAATDDLVEGEFIPAETDQEFTDADFASASSSPSELTYEEVYALVDEKIKEMDAKAVAKILSGRDWLRMDAKALAAFLGELNAV